MVEGSVFNCMGLNIFQLIFIIAENILYCKRPPERVTSLFTCKYCNAPFCLSFCIFRTCFMISLTTFVFISLFMQNFKTS